MNHSLPSPPQPQQPSAGISLGDIYYVLFRHKWTIILLSFAGILAAVAVYFFKPPPYKSQAELMIQYVSQPQTLTLPGGDQKVIVPDHGDAVIHSEIQILTSLDVAAQAATNIGPAAILADVGGGSNAEAAAGVIQGNLQVEQAGKGSSVILVTFQSPDPRLVQPVLGEVINDYLKRHKEIHSAGGQFDDALSREGAVLGAALNDTERQLSTLKNKASILSLADERQGLANQISIINGNILNAQGELAGYEARMKLMGYVAGQQSTATNVQEDIPQGQVDAYNTICSSLAALQKKEQGYLMNGFTKSNVLVMEVDAQISTTQKAKAAMEKKYPQIANLGFGLPGAGRQSDADTMQNLVAQVASLQAKLKLWSEQLDQLKIQATNLNQMAPQIAKLETTEAIQKENYTMLATKTEASHIQDAIDAGRTPNIKWVQSPSPPFRDWKKTHKKMAVLALGGLAFGLGWAFLIEFFLDRSVRRPIEVESKLKMPLFLSIPDVARNGQSRVAAFAAWSRLQLKDAPAAQTEVPSGDGASPPGKDDALQLVSLERNNPAMKSFFEALRDRLIVYFEVRNLTHKPKLVAVTSAGHGAGVSSIAAGLAASLSETGDGNVLLVDMNVERGAAQQFHKGKADCGLDRALESETKQDAMVGEHLYVVNGNDNSTELPHVLPKRFAALVPRLKASDYDYIIFDMPPVTETSFTPRLSRFMDMTLVTVESEKTSRDVVEQVNKRLVESGATVGAVLNKTRQYVPQRLHQESLANK